MSMHVNDCNNTKKNAHLGLVGVYCFFHVKVIKIKKHRLHACPDNHSNCQFHK